MLYHRAIREVPSGRRDTELFEMLSLHAFNIFFANLIEELDIHKANVIVGIHVLKKKDIYKHMNKKCLKCKLELKMFLYMFQYP